jgi:hypothetical protein
MATVFGMLRSGAPYFFVAVGLVWAAVGALTGSLLVAWPAVACLAGGVMLKLLPGRRLTWSWASATASMGFIVSAYQVYAWAPLVGGAFSTLAATTLAGFLAFALVHVLLFYAGVGVPKPVKSGTSQSTS